MADVPEYKLHKSTGKGYAYLPKSQRHLNGGKPYVYFQGKHGSKQSRAQYDAWIADNFLKTPDDLPADGKMTVLTLSKLFLKHSEAFYVDDDGKPTGEHQSFVNAMRWLVKVRANVRARLFSANDLGAVRKAMAAEGRATTYINGTLRRIRQVFKWSVEECDLPPSVWMALTAVRPAKGNVEGAVEPDEVLAVSPEAVAAIEGHCTRQVWGLVQFMQLTGCRPGEACKLRWCDIDAEQDAWLYKPVRHKNLHKARTGKKKRFVRFIYIGPKAQAVLNQFAAGRRDTDYVFSPQQALQEFTLANYGASATFRQVREHYTPDTLNRAVRDACKKAGVDRWHPNQLRHAALDCAADVDETLATAQQVAGHALRSTTEGNYLTPTMKHAKAFALQHG